jgi:hypothetical protein
MTTDIRPPRFSHLFAKELMRSASRRGWRAFFPIVLILCVTTPIIISFFGKEYLNKNFAVADAITIISSIAVIGSFLGASSVALTAHLQKIISEYPFANYLKSEGLFDSYLFWPQFVLLIQIVCTSICVIFNVVIGVFNLAWLSSHLIIFSLFIIMYAFIKTWQLIDLIRHVTWHYEDYMSQYHSEKLS